MKISRTNLLSLALIVVSFALAAALYGRLPALTLPHLSAASHLSRVTSKPWGPFVVPLLMVGVYVLFALFPRISPRGYRVERFQGAFEVIRMAILAMVFLANVLILLAGIGVVVPVQQAVHVGLGLFLVIAGNLMGKLTKNFFLGIRTPWTLASDEVWLRTHRLGGKLLVLAGIVVFVLGLLGIRALWNLLVILVAVAIPVAYSYVIYRRIEGFKNGNQDEHLPHA